LRKTEVSADSFVSVGCDWIGIEMAVLSALPQGYFLNGQESQLTVSIIYHSYQSYMASLPLSALASSIIAQIPDLLERIVHYEKATVDLEVRHAALEEAIKFVKGWEGMKQQCDTTSGETGDVEVLRARKRQRSDCALHMTWIF
jgi:hypothetical protein